MEVALALAASGRRVIWGAHLMFRTINRLWLALVVALPLSGWLQTTSDDGAVKDSMATASSMLFASQKPSGTSQSSLGEVALPPDVVTTIRLKYGGDSRFLAAQYDLNGDSKIFK